jgi:two-component system, chemotaxis family, chemotaxis protein CheY
MDFSKYKIVVIDDEAAFRKWLSAIINKYFKAQVFEANNPIDGLELIKKEKPDLIMLDMEMPVMDGFTALKEIRSNPETADTMVIICSGLSNESLFVSLVKLRITDYAVKSSGSKVIIDKIQRALMKLESKNEEKN